jgi:predicted DNA binding CopG/RHH family protein
VPVNGGKDGKNMKQKISYKNAPKEIAEAIASSEIIDDFLPPPDKLVLKEQSVRITINLSVPVVKFFKENAGKSGVPYQLMITKILDSYVETQIISASS